MAFAIVQELKLAIMVMNQIEFKERIDIIYITLKSIKRNLGLFNLEFEDLIIGGCFILVFTILFLLKFYTIAIVIISLGILALVPMDFSKCNRMYKLFLLFGKYLFKDKHYYFYK